MKRVVSITLILCILLTTIGQAQALEVELPIDLQDNLLNVKVVKTEDIDIDTTVGVIDETSNIDEVVEEYSEKEDMVLIEEFVEDGEPVFVEEFEVEDTEEEEKQDLVEEQDEIIEQEQSTEPSEEDKVFEDNLEVNEEENEEVIIIEIEENTVEVIEENTDKIESIDNEIDNEGVNEPVEEVLDGLVGDPIEEQIGVIENPLEPIPPVEQNPNPIDVQTSQPVPTLESLLPESIEILLPSKIVCKNGKNYLSVENLTEVPLQLTYVHIEGLNGWELVGYDDYKKINEKKLGVKVEGVELLRATNKLEKYNIIIPAKKTLDLEVEMVMAPQEKTISISFNIRVDVEIATEYIESQREYVKSLLEIERTMVKELYKNEENLENVDEGVTESNETEDLIADVDESVVEVEQVEENNEEISLEDKDNIVEDEIKNVIEDGYIEELEDINEVKEINEGVESFEEEINQNTVDFEKFDDMDR